MKGYKCVWIPDDLHTQLKVRSAQLGIEIKEETIKVIRKGLLAK